MTKPKRAAYGDRIQEVCEIVSNMGKATSAQVRSRMTGLPSSSNAAKYCSRAVGLGLMTVDQNASPMVYRVVTDWREIRAGADYSDVPEAPEKKPSADEILAMARRLPCCVWQLGSRAMGA